MAKKGGLGSGLGALFGDSEPARREESQSTLPISKVEPRSDQPRSRFDDAAQRLVEDGTLSAGHARALLPIRDEAALLEAARTVADKRLSVRQTEALVAHLTKAKARSAPAAPSPAAVDYVRELERELENALGRKVRLVEGRKKGRIELEYYGAEDREKLIENLRLFSSLRRNK